MKAEDGSELMKRIWNVTCLVQTSFRKVHCMRCLTSKQIFQVFEVTSLRAEKKSESRKVQTMNKKRMS